MTTVNDVFNVVADDPAAEMAALGRAHGIYPYFLPLEESEGTEVVMEGKRLVMAGSNNYLGLTAHPRVRAAAVEAVQRFGTSCTGSRLLNGTLAIHLELEERLARFFGKEDALVFATGYQSNVGAITALLGPAHIAVCDKEVHACILDGVHMAGSQLARFRHNDPEDLEAVLELYADTPAMVIVDGVYSMGGDLAKLPEIVSVARRRGARVYVDDAHGLGVVGPGGRGTAAHFDRVRDVDLIVSTFSKSLASVGGVVAGSAEVVDFIRHHARSMLFSAALPPSNTAAALAALDVLENEPDRPIRTQRHADRVRRELRAMGYDCGTSETSIVPVFTRDESTTAAAWKELLDRGVYTNPVMPPGVAPGRGMLRTSYMATHTEAQIDQVIAAFADIADIVRPGQVES
ncbi:aminotransferase class I/II-fold pyridoxal phosphate-dependent enzyme [Kibdelosporangium aridum]|uniref:8-amino-7-oxononanoate synthase n=1 Tax=Kibdelosporangium aridum TaxID=2030 RepID=A0A1Y5XWJ2_KIBAR|nr:pyridoxal phosphate-dependent aminotransferase family protein [Kibdelosporangium aridum]SMD20423.1 8-amino-7-oxononanoate synthase [Kibdelosporangium aridum]